MQRYILAFLTLAMLAGCGKAPEQPNTEGKKLDMVLSAAVSGDGLAVAVGDNELIINDGGVETRHPVEGFVWDIESSDTGVWAATDKAVFYVSRNGVAEYPLTDFPTKILPASGDAAYLIVDGRLVFVDKDMPASARRQKWGLDDSEPLKMDQEPDQGGAHFYDR